MQVTKVAEKQYKVAKRVEEGETGQNEEEADLK